jgi:hypothetical protein
VVKLGQEVT